MDSELERFLLVRARSRSCGLRLGDVVETLRPLPVELLAQAPAFVLGMAVIRGQPEPVIDLGLVLSEPGPRATRRWVRVRSGKRLLALAVEDVAGVRQLPSADFRALPPIARAQREGALMAIGVLDSGLLALLEAARLVPEEVWSRVERAGGVA